VTARVASVTDLQARTRRRWHRGHGRRRTVSSTVSDIIAQILGSRVVTGLGVTIGIAAVALWVMASWWAYEDAAHRTESSTAALAAAGWIILSTPLLLPFALEIYRLVRPPVSASDARSELLAIALSQASVAPRCERCRAPIDRDWRRCPACSAWLAAPCGHCGRWSEVALESCPWCGAEGHAEPIVIRDAAATTIALPAPWLGALEPALVPATAAAGVSPAAAEGPKGRSGDQRGVPIRSSVRPRSYAASRDSLSASS
jgi:RNA polymerase subunit RPABC4/transcription elongation factor Spt4